MQYLIYKLKNFIEWSLCYPDTLISVISALIAVGSALYSRTQAKMAKKQYELQLKEYTEGLSNFKIDILRSVMIDDPNLDKVYYLFRIDVLNLSKQPTSINSASLIITYNKNQIFKKLISTDDFAYFKKIDKLDIPLNVNAQATNSGWLIFSLPKEFRKSFNIDTYKIELINIHGVSQEKEEIFIKEVFKTYEFS